MRLVGLFTLRDEEQGCMCIFEILDRNVLYEE